MSAAITAYARIHMYPYISLPGCHYTDTDSVVLDKPLPDSEVSSYELGKLKLEHEVREGYFLAPKCYTLDIEKEVIIRNKGLAKDKVDLQWFIDQYKDISRTTKCTISANFRINWPQLNIYRRTIMLNLGIDPSTKRNLVIDENNRWIGTLPLEVSNGLVTRSKLPISNSQPSESMSPSDVALREGVEQQQCESRGKHEVEDTTLERERLELQFFQELQNEREQKKRIKEELLHERELSKRLFEELQNEREQLQRLFKELQSEREQRKRFLEELQNERSELQILEEQRKVELQILEEQRKVERSALTRLEEQFKAKEQNLRVSSALKEKEEGTSFSDKSGTSQPEEQRTQALNKGLINSTSEIRTEGTLSAVPQDEGLEPSNRVDRNNGKIDRDLKNHPLAREPPKKVD